jgi:hypothetical protein
MKKPDLLQKLKNGNLAAQQITIELKGFYKFHVASLSPGIS